METVKYVKVVDPRTEVELLRRTLQKHNPTENPNGTNGITTSDYEEVIKCFRKYLFKQESSWILDSSMVDLTRHILSQETAENKTRLLKLYAHCALREDFFSLFSNDRKNMFIMNYMDKFDSLSQEEQNAVSLLLCNASSHEGGRSFLLYFSKWPNSSGHQTCNADITAKIGCSALKSYNPTTKSYGLGLIYNLSFRNEFRSCDDVLKSISALAETLTNALVGFMQDGMDPKSRKLCENAIVNLTKPEKSS